MKKSGLSLLLCAALLALPAAAAEAPAPVSEATAGFSLEVPGDFYVITRDTPDDDPAFTSTGLDPTSTREIFAEQNIYLDAVTEDLSTEILVYANVNADTRTLEDLGDMSEGQVDDVCRAVTGLALGEGEGEYAPQVWEAQNARFIRLRTHRTVGELTIDARFYTTLMNGVQYTLAVRSYTGELTQWHETLAREAADSMAFHAPSLADNFEASQPRPMKALPLICILGGGVLGAGAVFFYNRQRKKRAAAPSAPDRADFDN